MTFILSEDEALKDMLKGIIVTDEKNTAREVGVYFARPDVESRTQSYPYITIELLDINWANYRQMSGFVVDSDLQGTRVPIENESFSYMTPGAWDLMYQITAYSRHPRHDRAIMGKLLTKDLVNKRGFLKVPNELGTEFSYRHMTLEDFAKRDTIEDGRRLYRSVFTVLVTSEASNDSAALVDVQTVDLNTNPDFVPSDLDTP